MTNILIYRVSTRYVKHVTLRSQLRNSLGSVFWPQDHILFLRLWTNCSLWTCSRSLMPYSIQFINNYKFLSQPLLRPAFLLFFLSPTGWHHRLNGHEFVWTPGVGDGQGCLVCCGSCGCKESDTTEWLNWTEFNKWIIICSIYRNHFLSFSPCIYMIKLKLVFSALFYYYI